MLGRIQHGVQKFTYNHKAGLTILRDGDDRKALDEQTDEQLVTLATFEEAKHPRAGGKFASKASEASGAAQQPSASAMGDLLTMQVPQNIRERVRGDILRKLGPNPTPQKERSVLRGEFNERLQRANALVAQIRQAEGKGSPEQEAQAKQGREQTAQQNKQAREQQKQRGQEQRSKAEQERAREDAERAKKGLPPKKRSDRVSTKGKGGKAATSHPRVSGATTGGGVEQLRDKARTVRAELAAVAQMARNRDVMLGEAVAEAEGSDTKALDEPTHEQWAWLAERYLESVLVQRLRKEGARDPEALAAWIGRHHHKLKGVNKGEGREPGAAREPSKATEGKTPKPASSSKGRRSFRGGGRRKYRRFTDHEVTTDWNYQAFEDWRKDLSWDEQNAVKNYAGNYQHASINAHLRRGDEPPAGVRNTADHLKAALERTEVPEDVVTYRQMFDPEIRRLYDEGTILGAEVTDNGFTSTTLDQDIVGDLDLENEKPMIARIDVPKGAKGATLNGMSGYPEEQELLLAPGTTFKITSVIEQPDGQLHMRMEVVEQ